ncbi:hypothetical protein BR93DRAFT_670018 [Coniochaeta sp. PMI_546]|nr:hypothetical protein BR93DRAFT_670018 [Coniochaeta sp. PMI_546]
MRRLSHLLCICTTFMLPGPSLPSVAVPSQRASCHTDRSQESTQVARSVLGHGAWLVRPRSWTRMNRSHFLHYSCGSVPSRYLSDDCRKRLGETWALPPTSPVPCNIPRLWLLQPSPTYGTVQELEHECGLLGTVQKVISGLWGETADPLLVHQRAIVCSSITASIISHPLAVHSSVFPH